MSSYLQTYGIEEERRGRTLKRILTSAGVLLIVLILGYAFFHNFPERQKAKHFLSLVNSHNYKAAYTEWGCTDASPCPNYDFGRFMQDWGPKAGSGDWEIASTDSCQYFLTINVQAKGSELQSLAVQRSDHTLGYAPAPECQERKWRWKQFFQHVMGKDPKPPADAAAPPAAQ